MTHLPAWDIRVALEQFPNNASSYIPSTMWSIIHYAVLAQCDGLDGIIDGIISDPPRCNFHPEVLACGLTTTNTSLCLNPSQIANLHRIYSPWIEEITPSSTPVCLPAQKQDSHFSSMAQHRNLALTSIVTPSSMIQHGTTVPSTVLPSSSQTPSIQEESTLMISTCGHFRSWVTK